ncbi:MAG: TrmB family transcriptional regulator [Patescibacteria group bacterium]
MLEKELQKLGLSDKEAKVYLASMELGPSPVQAVAQKSGVNRATTYVMIESLISRGLMSSFEKGKKKFFTAESPEQLVTLLHKEEAEIKEKTRQMMEILPELKILFAAAEEKPRLRFFEGVEGVGVIQEDILKSKHTSEDEIVALDEFYKIFPPVDGDHRKKMAEKIKSQNIKVRTIYTSEKGRILPTKEFGGQKERRFIPPEKFPFATEIVIYGNKVAMGVCKGKIIGVIIESKEVSEALQAIFNLAWEGAEKYQK